jgi:hypothetical protein
MAHQDKLRELLNEDVRKFRDRQSAGGTATGSPR